MPSPLIQSATEEELAFIAALDYGLDKVVHLEALRSVCYAQRGELVTGQYCFPYEVIQLGSNSLKSGHEREFAICTLLVIAAAANFDPAPDLESKLADRAQDYDRLPADLREEILNAYQTAGC